MLAFVIPLMSRDIASNWPLTVRALGRTLRSVCNQTAPEQVTVNIVCHERPAVGFDHPAVRFVEVDYPLNVSEKDPIETNDERVEIGHTDKGRKLLRGAVEALKDSRVTYLMMVDADDCVSSRIAAFVAENSGADGWLIEAGYRYFESRDFVIPIRREFYRECGSSLIIRRDLVPLPERPEWDRGYTYYRWFINHQFHAELARERGWRVTALPFPGAIYVHHGANWYGQRWLRRVSALRRALRTLNNLRKSQPIDEELRREFHLYPLGH